MTREEAARVLKLERDSLRKNPKVKVDQRLYDAYDIAIKALEQEPILDKIRSEIMQLDYNLESVDYDQNEMAMTEEVHMICREELLQIIDRYRVESEE